MKGDEFSLLIVQLKAEDAEAWLNIHDHVGILISSWARKEMLELDWVAFEEGLAGSSRVQQAVYSRLKEELLAGFLELDSYADYVEAISRFSRDILKEGFTRFNSIIVDNDNSAWKKVNARLYLYSAKWLSGKAIDSQVTSDIYQESVMTLFEKVTGKKLLFDSSKDFKSFYFRILELKTMESNRKATKSKYRFSEHDIRHLSKPVYEEGFEGDDEYLHIDKIMVNSISSDEYEILKAYYFHGEKLKDIARSLQISDLNCRQKKHHALKKIATIYQGIESKRKIQRPKKLKG